MQYWILSLRTRILAAAMLLTVVSITIVPRPALALVHVPRVARQISPELQASLQQGQSFEQQRQWRKALAHYEDLLRTHPDNVTIKARVTRARVCADVTRRYADPSYIRSVRSFDLQRALDVNREVMDLIARSYVDAPDWSQIVRLGINAIDTALSEPTFIDSFLRGVSKSQVSSFRAELRRVTNYQSVHSYRDALQRIAAAGKLAEKRLHIAPMIVMEYTCSAVGALDPYSAYLTKDQRAEVSSQINGNFVGVGIELQNDEDALLVVKVIEGSPAKTAGLKRGDRLIKISGNRLVTDISLDQAGEMLRGEAGSTIDVVVERPGVERSRIDHLGFRLVRRRIDVPSVEDVKIVDSKNRIGYFRISSFQRNSNRDVDNALWTLHRKGMRSLIIDLRGNPGGTLDASVEIADKFLTRGMIVSTRGRSTPENRDYRAHQVGTWGMPLVVLIDGNTASASEILAAAIHDNHRGNIIGERSYGKGSVQGIYDLDQTAGFDDRRAGVRMTVAKFYSPDGTAISNHGVVPDTTVRIVAKPAGEAILPTDTDPVLQAGINKLATRAVSSR